MSETGLAPRRAALRALMAVQSGAPLDIALSQVLGDLPDADRRLAHELAAGVLRRRTDLDARLIPLVRHGWGSVAPALREVLRLGAYQLTALDRVPAHAAVSTAVELAREAGGEKAARFTNAILRHLGGQVAPPAFVVDPGANLAAVHSHPEWLVRRWLARFGAEETAALLEWNNTQPSLVLQPARDDDAALTSRWAAAGFEPSRAPYDTGWVSPLARVTEIPGFGEGAFVVQDPAHALVARFAGAKDHLTVLDACAAPGGKSIALGRRGARIVSADRNRERVRRLAENLNRAGSGREWPVVADALHPPVRAADIVLLDAPCLGTGTFARHPDARWRATEEALASRVVLQAGLLRGAAEAVRVGGWLVYATCSLEPEENLDQVERFLSDDRRFERDPIRGFPGELTTPAGDLELLPQRHGTDGAFAARLRRKE